MPTLHRRRNPVALAEILRKGGVHEKSRKAKRQKQKSKLRKEVSKAMATYRGCGFRASHLMDLVESNRSIGSIKSIEKSSTTFSCFVDRIFRSTI